MTVIPTAPGRLKRFAETWHAAWRYEMDFRQEEQNKTVQERIQVFREGWGKAIPGLAKNG